MTALKGKSVALSVSDAPDRARLGLPAREVDRALFSICTVLVRAGAKIVYGGNLDPDGLTFGMFRHLAGAYVADGTVPFVHIIPEPVLRKASFDELISALREGASVVETQAHIDGALVPLRSVEDGLRAGKGATSIRIQSEGEFNSWLDTKPRLDDPSAFSAARKAMTDISDARVVLGGKMGLLDDPNDMYQGDMPGIVEEALLALKAYQPCVPLGAFGGSARDVAIALNLLDPAKRVPRGEQSPTYSPSLDQIAAWQSTISDDLRPDLVSLADDDRGEPMAYDIADLLRRWVS
ncbi:hypothetical protein [Kushneria indalinina]|uniref:hypothetical protein n=1 Tax=Kushneria indalinina TaxID=184067 RepID=UPI000E24FECA|nr:hypothetical protein [Kushneria indalinina]